MDVSDKLFATAVILFMGAIGCLFALAVAADDKTERIVSNIMVFLFTLALVLGIGAVWIS